MTLKLYIEPGGEAWIDRIVSNIKHTSSTKEECDYIVSRKISWGNTDASFIQGVLNSYAAESKKVLIFLVSDYNEPLDVPQNILFFRTGMYKSHKKQNEYLLPYIEAVSDLINHVPLDALQKRGTQPIIGFCGSIVSHPSRIQYINKLKMSPRIKKNFVLKTEYWGGNPHNNNIVAEFIKNIRESYFTLTTRGTGNWSARFYQVLYLGRVPVLVNTDIVLPFEDRINWRDIIVYCDSPEELNDKIMQFWNTKDIVSAQNACKDIYNRYLSIESWCKIITDEVLIPLKPKTNVSTEQNASE
jgi:hypothetical protein